MKSLFKISKENCKLVNTPSPVHYQQEEAADQKRKKEQKEDGLCRAGFDNVVGSAISAANHKANEIIRNAAEEARHTLTTAVAKSEMMLKAGYDKGLREGYDEGAKKAEAEKLAAVARLAEVGAAITDTLDGEKQALFEQATEFAFSIAEKIVNTALDRNDEIFVSMLENAATRLRAEDKKRLKVGPREYRIAQKYSEIIHASVHGMADFEIEQKGDDGSMLLESVSGSVDAGVRTQINRARLLAGGKG